MMMYLERENLLSREQEKDVLDIWKKSINEFPDVRLNLLIKYCNDNNCDFQSCGICYPTCINH